MDHEVPIHIGEGATLDGGPYENCEITGTHEGKVYIEDQAGETRLEDPDTVEDNVAQEIRSGEPVRVSGLHPDDAIATLRLPVDDAFTVDIHGGESVGLKFVVDDDRLRDVLSEATAEGADYHPIN